MRLENAQHEIEKIANQVMSECSDVTPEALGIDSRAGHSLRVSDDFIACPKGSAQRMLEYYGGFEYVDKEYVSEMGDWVIYSGEDSRVREHLNRFFDIN